MMTISFTRLHLFSLTLLDCKSLVCDMPDTSVITNDARMKIFVSYSYLKATKRNFDLEGPSLERLCYSEKYRSVSLASNCACTSVGCEYTCNPSNLS